MYKLNAVLATPNYGADEDIVYAIDLPDKRALHRVEKGLVNALQTLVRITDNELESGQKAFSKVNPQLVTLTVDISKDGADFGGYAFRWPNQEEAAREFLRGLLDGVVAETGHRGAKQARKKARK